MLEALIMEKYRLGQKRGLLPAVGRALDLHNRLQSLYSSEDRAFEWFASAFGMLGPAERGRRHELWDALENLEFFLWWYRLNESTPSLKKSQTAAGKKNPAAKIAADLSGGRPVNQPKSVSQKEKAQTPGYAFHRPTSPSPFPAVPLPDRRSAVYSLATWPQLIRKRHDPVQWAHMDSMRSSEPAHADHEDGDARGAAGVFSQALFTNPDTTHKTAAFFPAAGEHGLFARQEVDSRGPYPARGAASAKDRPATRPLGSAPDFISAAKQREGIPSNENTMYPEETGKESGSTTWHFLVSQSHGVPPGIFQRTYLEPVFPDLELADVRIHTDEAADRAARSLGADAFSLGRNIFFRGRRFNPSTQKGMALLGHELTHTRQIMNRGHLHATALQREGLEREAEIIETSLQRAITPGHASGHHLQPKLRGSEGSRYAPLSLEPARPMPVMPKDPAVRRGPERSVSLAAPGSSRGVHPLKAEEGRASAAGSAQSLSPSQGDQEGLTRSVMRSLERRIRIEKERRGVDRWVN